jgi:hypothetical protein
LPFHTFTWRWRRRFRAWVRLSALWKPSATCWRRGISSSPGRTSAWRAQPMRRFMTLALRTPNLPRRSLAGSARLVDQRAWRFPRPTIATDFGIGKRGRVVRDSLAQLYGKLGSTSCRMSVLFVRSREACDRASPSAPFSFLEQ